MIHRTVDRYLKTIPNDLIISTMDRDNTDERVLYLIQEYESLIEQGYNLPAIESTTTTKQLKEALGEFGEKEGEIVEEILEVFAHNYLPKAYKRKKREELGQFHFKGLMIFSGFMLFAVVIVVVLVYGVITNSLDPNSILGSFAKAIAQILGLIN